MADVYRPKSNAALVFVRSDDSAVCVGLRVNQRWTVESEHKGRMTLVNRNVRATFSAGEVDRYFRKVESNG